MTKKKVRMVVEYDVAFSGTFDEIHQMLVKIESGNGPGDVFGRRQPGDVFSVVCNSTPNGYQHDIVVDRLETDEQYEARLRQEAAHKAKADSAQARRREARRRQYEQLKKEFGDD